MCVTLTPSGCSFVLYRPDVYSGVEKTSVAFAASAELVLSANVQIVPEKQVPAARSKEVNFVVCFNMENLTFLLHDGSI